MDAVERDPTIGRDRSRAIMAAAAAVIDRSGPDALTMQNVAVEAGISLRSLYQQFDGKDALLIALIERAHIVYARLLEHHVAKHVDPLDRLGAAVYFATDERQHTEHPYNAAMAQFVVHVSMTASERLADAHVPVIDVYERLIVAAIAVGSLPPSDARISATNVFSACGAFMRRVHLGNDIGAPMPDHELLVPLCLSGLGADLPPGWVERFALSDSAMVESRTISAQLSGTRARDA